MISDAGLLADGSSRLEETPTSAGGVAPAQRVEAAGPVVDAGGRTGVHAEIGEAGRCQAVDDALLGARCRAR